MAFLEWRRFNFFDVVKDVDGGKVAQTLGDAKLTAYSSGNGIIVFGDSDGNVHLISRNFTISTFRAYDRNISLAEMSKESSFLVTIGEDEIGINPVIKVWNIDKEDRHGHPSCVRISRASLPNRAISTSCVCINSALTLMAVGFLDGSILFYRGDIKRERASKKKLLQEGKQSITGLAFRETEKCTYLFVVTLISVEFYDVTHKDREVKTYLDNVGCSPHCSVLMDSVKDSYFMICRSNAIYCYSTDGLGPCYAIDGEKVMLQWFRSYLVIVAKESKHKTQNTTTPPIGNQENAGSDPGHHILTVLDIQNKFIVFSVPLKSVQAVLAEWGSFYVVTGTNSICQLAEKDLQSKLALLFKKNFYDVSIRIAKSHQYDSEGLIDIFRQYGDHLYSKGDHNGAIEQYIKTIGSLEPSYVIRKFLASHQIDNLTTYLQALHKQGVATADHTTLLLNCYTKLNQVEKLKDFIMTEDRELDFDVEVAINVCRQSSSEDALMLARKHNLHSWYLKIQIEDNHQYSAALDYISKLEFSEAVDNMNRYGGILLEKAPRETTQFLKTLCTDYKPSADQKSANGVKQGNVDGAHPEDFLHLFVNNSESLVDFLEHLVQKSNKWGMFIYNTLIEHYLQIWSKLKLSDTTTRLQYELKIMRLLESPDSNCDKHHALILCQAVNFRSGLLHLYEENKMYQQILQYHLTQGDYQSVLTCCRRFGNQDSNIWVQALWAGARDENVPPYLLSEILGVVEKERLLSPLEVIDAVCSWKSVKIGDVRSYLNSILQNELKTADHEQALILKYTQETARIRKLIKNLQNSPVTFQGSRCSACNNQLELPSVHFLCQHSFHQHCFQSFSEQDNECPACLPNNKQIVDVIRAQVQKSDLHETFHSQLERAEDGFSLVADYFGRGIFNKFTVINDSTLRSRSISSSRSDSLPPVLKPSYSTQFIEVKSQKPERPKELGKQKMSLERYSSMLEANLTRDQHTALTPSTDSPETPLISVLANKQSSSMTGKNPFEDDDDYNQKESSKRYPQNSNPFYEDDDDDYDKNLNPFSS